MAAEYPAAVPTIANNLVNATVAFDTHATHHDKLADEVVAICTELGVNPSGGFATVLARLVDAEARISAVEPSGTQTYTITNAPATDRSFDAGTGSTLNDLKGVFATLIADLKAGKKVV